MECPACRGEGILPGPRICNRCKGIGKRARESEAKVVKVCGCGAAYNARAWDELEFVGTMPFDADCDLELRNCDCRTTLDRRMPKAAA